MAKTETSPSEDEQQGGGGKGRPTPTRAEQEAARRRPLAPNTKEARKEAAAKRRQELDKIRQGEARGEERYLSKRDKGPQRRFVRDFVDSKWHIGEIAVPVMFVFVIASLFTNIVYAAPLLTTGGLFLLILLVVLDMVWTSRSVKRKVAEKFGESRMESGLGWYAAMRSSQMRFMRLPKPQVRRGESPE